MSLPIFPLQERLNKIVDFLPSIAIVASLTEVGASCTPSLGGALELERHKKVDSVHKMAPGSEYLVDQILDERDAAMHRNIKSKRQ